VRTGLSVGFGDPITTGSISVRRFLARHLACELAVLVVVVAVASRKPLEESRAAR
jgi:hypothetical protein